MATDKLLLDEKLIGLVQDRPFLYDMSHCEYRATKNKENAWIKIAELMDHPDYNGNYLNNYFVNNVPC